MALFKIFVSSTCYDLGMVRAELRNFIFNLGHEPVMSEYNDILFDPKDHTHESCLKEIPNSDAVVLIVGSRHGGKAIPKAVSSIDLEKIKQDLSKPSKVLDNPNNISITQLEILKAIDSNIPIFTFVDSRVLHDHLFYEKNKDKGIIDSIEFPSIEKKDTAIYIFEFINFLRFRSKNNSISEFNKISDIEDTLKRQWSALLQRLLAEQKNIKNEKRKINDISEELKDIKSLVLSSISTSQAREVGRGVLRFRRLLDFLLALHNSDIQNILLQKLKWDELLQKLDIKEVNVVNISSRYRSLVFLIKNDETFYEYRNPISVLNRLASEWNSFTELNDEVKKDIISATLESDEHFMSSLRYREVKFDNYLKELEENQNSESTIITISRSTLLEQANIEEVLEEDDDFSSTDNDRI